MGLSGFGPEFPAPEAGRIPGYPTDPLDFHAKPVMDIKKSRPYLEKDRY